MNLEKGLEMSLEQTLVSIKRLIDDLAVKRKIRKLTIACDFANIRELIKIYNSTNYLSARYMIAQSISDKIGISSAKLRIMVYDWIENFERQKMRESLSEEEREDLGALYIAVGKDGKENDYVQAKILSVLNRNR